MKRTHLLAVVVLFVALTGGALALTGGVAVDGTIAIDAGDDGPLVHFESDGTTDLDLDAPVPDTHTVNITADGGAVNVSSEGSTEVTVAETDMASDELTVTSINASSAGLTIGTDFGERYTIAGSAQQFEIYELGYDDADADFRYVSSGGVDVTVNLPDTNTRVMARDADTDELLDDTYTDGDGNATFDLDTGDRSVYIEQAPEFLEVREELPPHDLLDDAEVEMLASGSRDTVSRQNVSNGRLGLEGLAIDEEYIVLVDAPGYHPRPIIVEDIFEQSTVFVLNESVDSVENSFYVVDNTGRFSSPKLIIDKPINRSLYDANAGGDQWTTVAGDRLGADSRLLIDLEQDARYRITIENEDGDRRELGEYTAGSDGSIEFPIGEIVWENPIGEGDGYRFEASQEEVNDNEDRITIQYEDESGNTDEFCVAVYESDNASNVLYPESCTASLGTYTNTIPVTGDDLNTSWVVDWSADRGNETYESVRPLNSIREFPIPLDDPWRSAIIYTVLIGGLAATPKAAARTGALVIVVMAFGLTWWGWVAIPGPALAITGAIALLGKAADFNKAY